MRAFFAAAGAAALSACVSVLPEGGPPPDIYRLNEPSATVDSVSGAGWTIEIPRPSAPRALSTDRVAVVVEAGRIAYVASARWEAPTPRIVQELAMDMLAASGGPTPIRPDDGIKADAELRIDLRRFEAFYETGEGDPPTIIVRFDAKLIETRERTLIANGVFGARERAASTRMRDVIAAFDAATSRSMAEMVAWASEAGAPVADIADSELDGAPET